MARKWGLRPCRLSRWLGTECALHSAVMSRRAVPLSVITILSAWLIAPVASASPITDMAVLVGEGFELRHGGVVTAEEIRQLLDREDNGLHRGWFKRKLRDGGGVDVEFDVPGFSTGSAPLLLPIGWIPPIGLPLAESGIPGDLLLPGTPGALLVESATSAAPVPMPEPASIVLLGTGLALGARRWRQRRNS